MLGVGEAGAKCIFIAVLNMLFIIYGQTKRIRINNNNLVSFVNFLRTCWLKIECNYYIKYAAGWRRQ